MTNAKSTKTVIKVEIKILLNSGLIVLITKNINTANNEYINKDIKSKLSIVYFLKILNILNLFTLIVIPEVTKTNKEIKI
jgi:hypothetical protein